MFDLEQSIADWRKQMLTAGIKTPVPLEELEIHLREEIGQQMKLGLNEQKAFEISTQRIGQPKMLKREFKKSKRTFMKKTMIILFGIFVVFIGTGLILPALGKHKQRNYAALSAGANFFDIKWAGDETYGLVLGTAFVIGGASTTVYGFKKRKA
jgi:hypothetical protein